MGEEIGVWLESESHIGSVNFVTTPVSSIVKLQKVIEAANQNMMAQEDPSLGLLFRGQDSDLQLLPKSLNGRLDLKRLKSALSEMMAVCRNEIGGDHSDSEICFMMRHAGLPSNILDWSWRWEVALWFAIHDSDGSIKMRESSLWVLRPVLADVQGRDTDNVHVAPVFFPADQQTCEMSRGQDACAYKIRFERKEDGAYALPMNRDDIYSGRLLRVPIEVSAHESLAAELRSFNNELDNLMKAISPLSRGTIETCRNIFLSRMSA